MQTPTRICLISGFILLILTIINGFSTDVITPSFQRAEVLAGLSGVCIMLVGVIWSEIKPTIPKKENLVGKESFYISEKLNDEIKLEMAWASQLFLESTGAATILIYWDKEILLRRGLISDDNFTPGPISKSVMKSQNSISLVKTKLFPGRKEFDPILEGLPSIIVEPLSDNGIIILGGWTERCFTKSDEKWLKGWAIKISEILEKDISHSSS